jgi:hypothetical protein
MKKINDKMYFFTLGFAVATLVSMVIISWMPSPQPEFRCGGCGSPDWYSVVVEGDLND